MMRIIILTILALSYQSVQAEVFKCIGKAGKTLYQSKPCQALEKEQQLDIRSDPAKEAEAKARAEAVRNEYEARKAAKLEAERNEAALRNQTESTMALKQSAIAQQQQVLAEQRQAEALERQARQYGNPAVIIAAPPVVGPGMVAPVTTIVHPSR